jgi:hypothetical protein
MSDFQAIADRVEIGALRGEGLGATRTPTTRRTTTSQEAP